MYGGGTGSLEDVLTWRLIGAACCQRIWLSREQNSQSTRVNSQVKGGEKENMYDLQLLCH
jgi:hypothetical protein